MLAVVVVVVVVNDDEVVAVAAFVVAAAAAAGGRRRRGKATTGAARDTLDRRTLPDAGDDWRAAPERPETPLDLRSWQLVVANC